MPGNNQLHAARQAQQDEFYTQMNDITNELCHYAPHFRGKTVFCNCDDPYESNFSKYFVLMFNDLGLKKLICTCYDGSPIAGTELALFDEARTKEGRSKVAYKIEITDVPKEVNIDNYKEYIKENCIQELNGNGDFRSAECMSLLEQSDIVVTNPPFSLFREYVAQLVEYGKKFIIIGNKNAITYKEIFPLIKENKMWVGVTPMTRDMHFIIPQSYISDAQEKQRASALTIENGNILGRSPAIWFTNIDHAKRHYPLDLYKRYTPEEYPKYDNYDAIEIGKTVDIPIDYDEVMGVPITFLDKYCPEQFEIIELGNSRENFTPNKDYINPIKHMKDGRTTSGGAINSVLTLSTKEKPVGSVYYTSDNSDYLIPPYARILIRKK